MRTIRDQLASRNRLVEDPFSRSGVGNLRHACHIWHVKKFPTTNRSSSFTFQNLVM